MGAFRSASLETASGKDPPATLLRRCYVAAACLPQAGLEPGERAKGERSSPFSPPSSRPEQAVFSSARFLRAACGAEGPWRKPLPTSTRVNSYSRNRIAATVIPTVTGDFFRHSRFASAARGAEGSRQYCSPTHLERLARHQALGSVKKRQVMRAHGHHECRVEPILTVDFTCPVSALIGTYALVGTASPITGVSTQYRRRPLCGSF